MLVRGFITGLPSWEYLMQLNFVVDKLFKRAKYTVVNANDESMALAKLCFDTVICHHGLPKVSVTENQVHVKLL